ncbi:hypothetical protein HanOQP8_Chr17g0653591 [Helianthus annuus]|nr:hypothetical protein HanIR_Chr17g0861561 [Helianthus annuus]KAJ0458069.1 hypothetical protein HanIR_Chr15g0780901 [Helianthus annuus]KAJ0607619.1 hypothetical protein HanHA89_Chr03g0098861 [Helianthus annuus]KAJ0635682.1 hypothetical protein HanOQP8_Chr17g0653591 [Helianthus annuus]
MESSSAPPHCQQSPLNHMATIGLQQQQEQNKDRSLSPQSEIDLFLQGFNFTNICFV